MKRFYLAIFLAVLITGVASAGTIPPGWSCTGNCGMSGADGVVTLSPFGNAQYKWISSDLAPSGGGTLPAVGGDSTNGSTLTTAAFPAIAGDALNFYFNYVTSDGVQFADYAWVQLIDTSNPAATVLLFTARTTTGVGNTVPGAGMPPVNPGVTVTPSAVAINAGLTTWSPLGSSSGTCYVSTSSGCGFTGWVQSLYNIPVAGNYQLAFGVSNWLDTAFDSGLAIDGVTIGGNPIPGEDEGTVPEPGSMILLGSGLIGLSGVIRRKLAR